MRNFSKIIAATIAIPFFLLGFFIEAMLIGFRAGVEWLEKVTG